MEALKKIKVCAYARFSSSNQRFESIATQLDAINKFCKSNNMEIVETYTDEAKTATNDDRTGFLTMIERAKLGKFQAIVLYSLDRFSRNASNHYYYKSILDSYGIKLFAVIDGINGSESAEALLMENFKVGLAEYFSAHLSKLILDSCIMTSKSALKVGGSDNLGFYTINQKYYINEEEAITIRKIFDLAINNYSYADIANYLNENNIKTKKGNKFYASTVLYILQNKKYNGYMIYNRFKRKQRLTDKKVKRVPKNEDEHIIIPNAIPRIIEDEVFNKVQKIIERKRMFKFINEYDPKYLLSGFVVCSECDSKFHHETCKKGKSKKTVNRYRCSSRNKEKCNVMSINADYLNEFVLFILDFLYLNTENRKLEYLFNESVTNYIKEIDIRINNLLCDDETDRKEIEKFSSIADSTDGLARETMLSAVRERIENSLERQIAIKSLIKQKNAISEKPKFNIEKITSWYQRARNSNNPQELREFIYNNINKILISNELVTVRIDISKIAENYSSLLYYDISENRNVFTKNFSTKNLKIF